MFVVAMAEREEEMKITLWFGCWSVIASILFVTDPRVVLARPADYAQAFAQCGIDKIAGNFTEQQSTYSITGSCEELTPDPKGGGTPPIVLAKFIWSAAGTYQPGKYNGQFNTTEALSVRRDAKSPLLTNFYDSMFCKQDPWLEPYGLSCGPTNNQAANTGDAPGLTFGDIAAAHDINDYLYDQLDSRHPPVLPISSRLSAQQRDALVQQYNKQLASNSRQRLVRVPSAPVITLPIANSNNVEGRFQVKGQPIGSSTYTGAELVYVQFTFLGTATAPGPTSFVNTFKISLKDLFTGVTVPNTITRGGQGRWLVRAQIVDPPNAGPWSASVPFNLNALSSKNLPSNLNRRIR